MGLISNNPSSGVGQRYMPTPADTKKKVPKRIKAMDKAFRPPSTPGAGPKVPNVKVTPQSLPASPAWNHASTGADIVAAVRARMGLSAATPNLGNKLLRRLEIGLRTNGERGLTAQTLLENRLGRTPYQNFLQSQQAAAGANLIAGLGRNIGFPQAHAGEPMLPFGLGTPTIPFKGAPVPVPTAAGYGFGPAPAPSLATPASSGVYPGFEVHPEWGNVPTDGQMQWDPIGQRVMVFKVWAGGWRPATTAEAAEYHAQH